MTAKIIPFPRRPPPPDPEFMYLEWTGLELDTQKCSGNVHYFTDREGTCQCGQEVWPKPAG